MVAKIQATKMDLDFKDGEVDGIDWKKKFEDEMEKQRNKDKDPAKKKKPKKGMFAKSKNMSAGAKAGGAENEFSTSNWNSKGK
jgi:RNA processing factor Prp31|tara:strand:+ start:1283 stop:1531 length:249 start_codon:yes stop_codon:yes gene_type:complete